MFCSTELVCLNPAGGVRRCHYFWPLRTRSCHQRRAVFCLNTKSSKKFYPTLWLWQLHSKFCSSFTISFRSVFKRSSVMRGGWKRWWKIRKVFFRIKIDWTACSGTQLLSCIRKLPLPRVSCVKERFLHCLFSSIIHTTRIYPHMDCLFSFVDSCSK